VPKAELLLRKIAQASLSQERGSNSTTWSTTGNTQLTIGDPHEVELRTNRNLLRILTDGQPDSQLNALLIAAGGDSGRAYLLHGLRKRLPLPLP
jgi:hypothetical protein